MADGTLFVDLGPGDTIKVGDAVVELVAKSGQKVRLRVQAPREVRIERPSLDNKPSPQSPGFVPRLPK